MLSEQQYIEKMGLICPRCESDKIDVEHAEFDGDYAWQVVECSECSLRWVDDYSLTGYTITED
jgi:DNA-directed RNA polymerase subunit RPC12/RpoP